MRTRIFLMLAFGILARAGDAGAQPAPPCPGGQSTGVVHVYSECRPDGFWHVVTDEYFMCPAGRAQSLRINDVTTDQRCGPGGAPQPARARLVQELVPGRDAFPERMGHFIFLECINGYWHRVWYLRYRLPNGEFRFDRDAVHIERTDQPCGSPPPPVVDPNRGASVASAVSSPISIAKRAAAGGAQALLIEFPARVSAKNVTEVRLRLPRPAAESAKIAIGPERWSIVERGNQLRLTGPGVSSTDPFRLRLDIGRNAAPNEVETELYVDGKSVARERVKTATAPPPVPSADPGPLIALPPTIVLTEPVVFTPLSPDLTPSGGTWTIGGVDAKKLDTPPLADPNEPLRYRLSLGEVGGKEWKLGASVGIRYRDKWGDTMIDSPGGGIDIALPPPVDAKAGITDCTKKVFQGRILCVCGWFPESVRGSLMLGGRALGYPVTSSFNALYFRVPPGVEPGPYVITAPGVTGSARVEVLGLAGDVDRNELLRGQSTPLRLQILGTEDALEIRLKNLTPGIISLSGGDDQVVRTSGGASNIYQGTVRGLSPGDFNITYELTTGSCPCNEQQNSSTTSVSTQPEGETWYDDAMRSFRRGRELANDARDSWLGRDPTSDETADEARVVLTQARERLRRGVQSGDIGGETAKLLEQYIEGYETQVRSVPPMAPAFMGSVSTSTADPIASRPDRKEEPVVTTVTDGWFEPSQGVWQDDKRFKDAPDKQLTRMGPTSWKAELKMVAGRQTVIYGNREHDYIRVAMNGTTTGSRLVKVRFRFKLIDSGGERIIWEQAKAENYIPIDGPAGPPEPWGASLQTHRGVPEWSEFTIKPGPYTIEMELVRDEGTPTGLKVTLSGEAVETAKLPLRLVPVALSDAAVGAPGALVAQAQRIATEAGEFVPQTFPMKPASFAPTVEPLLDLRTIEPGRFDTFISLLPGTDAIEQVRGERVATTIEDRFGTSAGLTGGGKTAIVLTEDDFGRLWRQTPDFRAAAYTHSAKLIVLLDSNEGTTLAHELIHTLPYLWSKPQMQALFGFSYHNSDDIGYASGPTVTRYYRERFDGTDAIMGPSGGSKWITQGSYFHLLSELRSVPDPDLIVTRGFIARTGTGFVASFNPLYQVVGEPDLRARAAATGEFAIVLRDRAGVERGRYPFGVSWQLPDIDVNRTTTAFMHRVPDSPDVAEIQIVGPNGNVLDRRRRSASAPAVSITSPVANATVTPANDKIRIQWTASDADRDALTYMVLYSPDGGANWRVASYEQTATSFDLPIVGRPSAPRVRVIATDGARSRTAEVSFSFLR